MTGVSIKHEKKDLATGLVFYLIGGLIPILNLLFIPIGLWKMRNAFISISYKTKNFKPKASYEYFLWTTIVFIFSTALSLILFAGVIINSLSWLSNFVLTESLYHHEVPVYTSIVHDDMALGVLALTAIVSLLLSFIFFIKSFIDLDNALGTRGFHSLIGATVVMVLGIPFWVILAAAGLWIYPVGIIGMYYTYAFAKGLAFLPNEI